MVPRTQGFQDTVRHEENGYLFAPGNETEASQYIKRLRDDRALLQRMGDKAVSSVVDKSIGKVIEDLLAWYAHGKLKQRGKSMLKCVAIFLNLLWALPVAIISLGVYEILVCFIVSTLKS